MNRTIVALLLSAAFGSLVGTAALAQQTPAQAQAAVPAQPAAPATPTSREEAAVGQQYAKASFSDWTLRCLRIEGDVDPCELHQVLLDQRGDRVAEFNIFPLNQQGVSAGATLVTPLETLLTRNVSISIDGAQAKMYPFAFCTRVGCIAQMGVTEEELNTLRAGQAAKLVIVPAAAPTQQVELTLSLKGFTAAYKTMSDLPRPAPQQ